MSIPQTIELHVIRPSEAEQPALVESVVNTLESAAAKRPETPLPLIAECESPYDYRDKLMSHLYGHGYSLDEIYRRDYLAVIASSEAYFDLKRKAAAPFISPFGANATCRQCKQEFDVNAGDEIDRRGWCEECREAKSFCGSCHAPNPQSESVTSNGIWTKVTCYRSFCCDAVVYRDAACTEELV